MPTAEQEVSSAAIAHTELPKAVERRMHTSAIHLGGISSQVEQFHSSAFTASVSGTTFNQWRGWKSMTKAKKKTTTVLYASFSPHKTATVRLKGGWAKDLCAAIYEWKTACLKSNSKTHSLVRSCSFGLCTVTNYSGLNTSSPLEITNPWNPVAKLTSHTYEQGSPHRKQVCSTTTASLMKHLKVCQD